MYKSVDRFIKDAYASSEGISEYIRRMEAVTSRGIRFVRSWQQDYEMLKRVRWIRNQLAHEVGYDSDICNKSDYDRLSSFNKRLYAAEDPLALLRKQEMAERQRLVVVQRKEPETLTVIHRKDMPTAEGKEKKKLSLWKRIKRYFAKS